MVTKGIIKTLDLTGNTCTVRLPLFETAGNDHIIGTATISNTPGSYNGYKEGDVVWVAFEDGSMNSPVVIGKLYLGVEEERKDPRGVLNVENSTVAKTASMPADTKLSVQTDHNIPNTTSPFGSLSSIANNLNALNTSVAQNNRDYGNKFKQVASEIDNQGTQFRSALTQTAKEINAEVSRVEEDLEGKITETNSNLTLTADNINAEVSTKVSSNSGTDEQAFGWNLKSDEWTVYNKTTEKVTSADDLWVDILQKIVKVEETADDGTIIEKDVVKQYYAINNIITTREVENGETLPTVESTGDSIAPWAWVDTGSLIEVLNESPETVYLTDVPKVKKVLIANKDGLKVAGTIEAEDGDIGSFTIGKKGENGHSGIYSDNYITKYSENPGTKTGVYVGTDGIKLGSDFSVDTTGKVTATGLRINLTDEQKNELSGTTTITYAYHSDGKTPPSIGWSTEIPELSSEEAINSTPYFWTKTETTFAWSDTPKAPKISYTVSKIGSSVKTEVLYKLSTSSTNAEVYKDDWSTNVKVPTKAVPYVWTKTRVITNGESEDSTPTLHDSFDNLISILSVDGIDLIYSTDSNDDGNKEYHLKADTLSGAVSDNVTIGGFTIGSNSLNAGSGNGNFTIQTTTGQLDYTPAEYIESNGNQYIDTEVRYNPAKIYTVNLKISYNTVEPSNQICGFTANRGCGIGTAGDRWWLEDGQEGDWKDPTNSQVKVNQQYNLTFIKGKDFDPSYFERYVDNKLINKGTKGNTTITSNTFWLFNTNSSNCACKAKIYLCQIYEDGKLIRDFKPALKDNKYCLYDLCTRKFYSNQGTGWFTGSLATEDTNSFFFNGVSYTRLDYIQNTGDNYIEFPSLSFDKTEGVKVEMVVEPTSDTVNSGGVEKRCALFTSYSVPTSTSASNISLEIHTSSSNNNLTRCYVDNADRISTTPGVGAPGVIPNQKNKIIAQIANGKCSLQINEAAAYTGSDFNATGTWEGPFRIFVDNYDKPEDGYVGGRFSVFSIPFKLYSCNIYSGTQLVAKLVPAINESTQTPGLINLATGYFYTNEGNTKFNYGEYTGGGKIFNGINDDSNNTYRVLEYIEGTGSQYTKTGWKLNPATDSFEIISQATETPQDGGILGAYSNTTFMLFHTTYNDDIIGLWGYYKTNSSDSSYTYGYLNTGCAATDLKKHTFKYESVKMYTDGIKTTEKAEAKSASSDELFMFALNNGGGASHYYKGRIYSCKIWRNATLKRDFIPVIQNELKYGMYDLIDGIFYENMGTGAFKGKGFAQEFTALYLGSPDAETAPFSVTNTGKVKATSGNIGGFKLSNNVLESGTRGSDNSIIVASSGQTAEIANSWNNDWLFTVGKSFGINSNGQISVSDGIINGTLSTTECYLQNVKEFNFVGNSLQIGGMQLTNELLDVSTATSGSETFTLKSGTASYIGSNSLYALEFTCNKPAYETTDLGWTVANSSWYGNKSGYPVYNTIEFNQPLVLLKGTKSIKINAVGNDRGLYGSWTFNFITLKNTSTGETKTLWTNDTFPATVKTTASTPTYLLSCSGGFIPASDGGGTLGRPTQAWGNIFGQNIYSNGSLYTSGNVKFKANRDSTTGAFTGGYDPVINVVGTGGGNAICTARINLFKHTKGKATSKSMGWTHASWADIGLPTSLQNASKIKGVYVTGYVSDRELDVTNVTEGDCGKTSTSVSTVTNFAVQGFTPYVHWTGSNVYVLSPKVSIAQNVESFDVDMCLLIVGQLD